MSIKILDFTDFSVDHDPVSSGSYGKVYKATYYGKHSTLNVILKKSLDSGLNVDNIKEIVFLNMLQNYPESNVVKFYGITYKKNIRGKISVYLVLEELDDNFKSFIGKITDINIIKKLSKVILTSFKCIHELGIIHNDIKPENIMIKYKDDRRNINNIDIKIIDFGLAEFIGIGPYKNLISKYITTADYMAPDNDVTYKNYEYLDYEYYVHKNFKIGNRKSYGSDIFSIGALLLSLPFGRGYYDIKNNIIKRNDVNITEKCKKLLNDDGFELIINMMNNFSYKRYSAKRSLDSSFFYEDQRGGDCVTENHIVYTLDEYLNRYFELEYMNEIFDNYSDKRFINKYDNDKLYSNYYSNVKKYLLKNCDTERYSFDTIISCNNTMKKLIDTGILSHIELETLTDIVNIIYNSIYSYIGTTDIEEILKLIGINHKITVDILKEYMLIALEHCNLNIMPIYSLISYSYTRIVHENKIDIDINYFSNMVLFIFLQISNCDFSYKDIIFYCLINLIMIKNKISLDEFRELKIIWLDIDYRVYNDINLYYNNSFLLKYGLKDEF